MATPLAKHLKFALPTLASLGAVEQFAILSIPRPKLTPIAWVMLTNATGISRVAHQICAGRLRYSILFPIGDLDAHT